MQIKILIILITTIIMALPCKSFAVTLPWSTTYPCNEVSYGGSLCDGLSWYGGWTCSPQGYYEQVTSAANNPAGGGGRGQRHWLGDGINNVSGGTRVTFASVDEIWIRWYMKFPSGFTWNTLSYQKWIYSDGTTYWGWYGNDGLYFILEGGNYYSASGTGWTTTMGGATGDGQWHAYETHFKKGTGNGIVQQWIDGVLVYSNTSATITTSFTEMMLGENIRDPGNGGCVALDIDDVAISATGYIGLLGASGPSQLVHTMSAGAVDGGAATFSKIYTRSKTMDGGALCGGAGDITSHVFSGCRVCKVSN